MKETSDLPPGDLSEISLNHWLRGDWRALCAIPFAELEKHPRRRHLVLYRVAAHRQLGEDKRTRDWIKQAFTWGCDATDLCRMLAACSLLAVKQIRADHFRRTQAGRCPPAGASAKDEASGDDMSSDALRNALLSEAAEITHRRIIDIEIDMPQENDDFSNQITVLKSELGILKQTFNLRQARDTLKFGVPAEDHTPGSLAELEEKWRRELASLSTSQLGQDLWVLEKCSYKRNGFFVEFGATDGIVLSNTFLLEKAFGWNGICAEPNPKSFAELSINRLCTVANTCIGPVSGEEVEFIFADAYGGMSKDADSDKHKAKRDAYRDIGETSILKTVSLHDFLKAHNAPRVIDYISIDTEGSEFAILETFPFNEWDVHLLSVEHNYTEQRQKIRGLLEAFGYQCHEAQWDDWYYKPDAG